MDKSIVLVASYYGPYPGNFIASLLAYDKRVKAEGYRTIYVFPEDVKDFCWVPDMKDVADALYFIPYRPRSLNNIRAIRKICKTENAVMIYSRMGGWDYTARLAMPFLPVIWHMEMGVQLSSRIKRIKYFVKYRVLGFGKTYFVSVSKKGAEALNTLKMKHPCVAIPNAPELSRLHTDHREFPKEGPVNVLIFGYNPPVKGLDLALDACENLNRETVQFRLLVSAQERTYAYMKERYPEQPEWVELLPPTNDIASVYDKADIMLSASRNEGFSYCCIEALYSGLPVVYSDIPGTSWIDDFEGCVKFKTANVNDLCEALSACRKKGISMREMEMNRQIIERDYSIEAWVDKTYCLIKSAIKDSDAESK